VFERPSSVSDGEILAVVRDNWADHVTLAEHVPVGFGAWHWRVSASEGPVLFVSLDPPYWHTAGSIERAYASVGLLARTLDFVHAPLPTPDGTRCVPLGDGWLSATPWIEGASPTSFTAEAAGLVRRLHAAEPPAGAPVWESQVDDGLVDELRDWVGRPWDGGPFGETARTAVRDRLSDIDRGLHAHRDLTERLDPSSYVPTHGEPDVHNQRRSTDGRLLLVDWESFRLAPAERDLLGATGNHVPGDPALVTLFRLEWALNEVRSYSDWLRGPHGDDADTRTAVNGLTEELGSVARVAEGSVDAPD
jgi:spectinomycin phosphotransferase